MSLPYSKLLAFGVFIIIFSSCSKLQFRTLYEDANQMLHTSSNGDNIPFLKAHMKNGDVYILGVDWKVDTMSQHVIGNGIHYDFNRKKIQEGKVHIAIDEVAIFETNIKLDRPEHQRMLALSILTGVNIAAGIYCIIFPKVCFGSCPTFYLNEDDNFHYADAESFSHAITPTLMYRDIDALNTVMVSNNHLAITMKNEALETHCIKDLKILAWPLNGSERVFQSENDHFYLCDKIISLTNAFAYEGNVTELLSYEDRKERFSPSDENNLSSKEEIIIDFENKNGSEHLGFILHYRQTLMTTYLIYSAMGYMGDKVGDIFAKFETNKNVNQLLHKGIKKELGNIDVYIWDVQLNKWVFQDAFFETGPIAINRKILPLKNVSTTENIKIKIVLNKGLWRLDYAGLATIKQEVFPEEYMPVTVLNKNISDLSALSSLQSKDRYLISMPGDEYKFGFSLPGNERKYELFLSAKGYYLEWMRDDWIKDKDLMKLRQIFFHPGKFLKEESMSYKKYESTMEELFWNSKIDTKKYSYYEN